MRRLSGRLSFPLRYVPTSETRIREDGLYLLFNSNAEFKAPVGKELLPLNGEKLVGAEWPGKRKPFKHLAFYPYERNKHSSAYIPPREDKPYIYYMGGINGGEAADYLEMAETLSENIHADYEKVSWR